MKLHLKNAFHHVFTDGDAKPLEFLEVFITISIPVIIVIAVVLVLQQTHL